MGSLDNHHCPSDNHFTIVIAGGVTTDYEQISNTIIAAYKNIIGRYSNAIGYDYWIGDFVSNLEYINLIY